MRTYTVRRSSGSYARHLQRAAYNPRRREETKSEAQLRTLSGRATPHLSAVQHPSGPSHCADRPPNSAKRHERATWQALPRRRCSCPRDENGASRQEALRSRSAFRPLGNDLVTRPRVSICSWAYGPRQDGRSGRLSTLCDRSAFRPIHDRLFSCPRLVIGASSRRSQGLPTTAIQRRLGFPRAGAVSRASTNRRSCQRVVIVSMAVPSITAHAVQSRIGSSVDAVNLPI